MDELHARCRKIKEEDLELIRCWRMRPDITKYMNTDPVITPEDQKRWFEGIQRKTEEFYWMLEVDGVPSGVVSLVNMERAAKRIYTGVYIAEKQKRSLRLTMELQWNLYRYAFEELGMEKVCEEVFAENKAVNRILDMCGSKAEGVLRSHVFKNGIYYDVVVRGILREEWETVKAKREIVDILFE